MPIEGEGSELPMNFNNNVIMKQEEKTRVEGG